MYKPDEVIKQYSNAIFKVANTYYARNSRFSHEDLVAEAKVAAVQACESYDKTKKASFFTYLTSSMNREVQKYVKRNCFDLKVTEYRQRKEFKECGNNDKIKSEARAISLDQGATFTSGGSKEFEANNFHAAVASGNIGPDIIMMRQESLIVLKEEIGNLPDRERHVLNGRWLEGKTLEQIADGFGVTKQTIHGWGKKGFERLQKRVRARLGDELVF